MKTSSITLALLLPLLLTIPNIGNASHCIKKQLVASLVQANPEDILARSKQAIEVLLNPQTPLTLVKEFDYGVAPNPDFLEYQKSHGLMTVDQDSLPTFTSFGTEPNQPILLESPYPRPESRLSYFAGNIFSDSYFARHSKTDPLENDRDWSKFIQAQPWLELIGDQYQVHTEGASRQILNALPGKRITLYRGTVAQEAAFSAFLKKLLSNKKPSVEELTSELRELGKTVNPESNLGISLNKIMLSQIQRKRKAVARTLAAAFAKDLQGSLSKGSLFVTTSPTKAKTFSKGMIVTYSILKSHLDSLLQSGKLYVGVESEVEMAFVGPDAVSILLHEMTDARAVKQEGNIWDESSPSFNLWR